MKSKYNSLVEWRNKNPEAYNVALKNGWISDLCKKFNWIINKKQIKKNIKKAKEKIIKNKIIDKRITLKECLKESQKHKTPWEWHRASPHTYNAAKENGWFNECCKNLKSL